MKFTIQYEMDHVGYTREFVAESKEQAIVLCVDELRMHYPVSVVDIINVSGDEKIEGKVEKKKKSKEVKL